MKIFQNIQIKPLYDVEELLYVLQNAEDYVIKADGVMPDLNMAEAILKEKPPGTQEFQKIVLGIYYKDQIIGFFDLILDYPNQSTMHIGLLLIVKTYRAKGFGTLLINELKDIASFLGYKKLRAAIIEENKSVEKFWLKSGFTAAGIIKEFEGKNNRSSCGIYECVIQ
ncbi:MAG: GNAT family N-acetyltransferase [Chitinophagales bacterium]